MRRASAVAVALILAVAAGCGDDPEGGSAPPAGDVGVEQVRDDVRAGTAEVAGVLGEAGLRAVDASGQYSTCGGEPDPEMEYAAGALLRPADGASPAEGVAAAEQALTDAGWRVDASGEDPAYVNVSRGALRVSVKESRLDPGDLDLEVGHPCVDGTRADVPDLEPEPIDVG